MQPDVQHEVEPDVVDVGAVRGGPASGTVQGADTGVPWALDRLDQIVRPIDGNYEYTTDGSGIDGE